MDLPAHVITSFSDSTLNWEWFYRNYVDIEEAEPFAITSGTTFPSSPANDDIFVYNADITNGIKWSFQYRSASASSYKWEFIGGGPLLAEVVTSETTTSTSYAALTTSGPSIILPLAGDYIIDLNASSSNASNGITNHMSYDIGGSAAADVDALQFYIKTGSAQDSGFRNRLKTGLSAVTLTSKYKVSGGTGTFLNRSMSVRPIRV